MEDAAKQRRRAGLTRERVLDAGVLLVDRDGAAALSMRKLANELGVEAMTLYHYVRNKEALEDAIVEHVLAESVEPIDDTAAWQEIIATRAFGLHRALLRHSGAVALIATRPAITDRNLDYLEELLRVLCRAGFAPATALQIIRLTALAVIGHHLTGEDRTAEALDSMDGAYPMMAEAVAAGSPGLEARLTFNIEALIAGFERLLP